jgi:drug/metabolite transporter (DMT)-like permease
MNDSAPEFWIALALVGAVAQTTRNATAQTISAQISPSLNSWSRFAFCLPYAAAAAALVSAQTGWPTLSPTFFAYCLATALAQLLGNVALVSAFRAGRFGESIVFHKLEVALTAIAGALWFAELPSRTGAAGILLCVTGVIVMNLTRGAGEGGWRRAFRFGRPGVLALLCAVLLVFASFFIKLASAAIRSLDPETSFFEGAVQTLFHTTWIEVVLLSAWIGWKEPRSFLEVGVHWRRMLLIGSSGFTASLCWFWAFSLTFVAYVKAVGQLEALLAVALGIRLMGEHDLWRQLPGVGLTVLGIALVLLG